MFDLSPLIRHIFVFSDIQEGTVHYSQGEGARGKGEWPTYRAWKVIGLNIQQVEVVSKFYMVSKTEIVPLLPVKCYFRIGSIFWNNFLHINIAQFDFSCSRSVDWHFLPWFGFFSTFFFCVFSRGNLTPKNFVPWCASVKGRVVSSSLLVEHVSAFGNFYQSRYTGMSQRVLLLVTKDFILERNSSLYPQEMCSEPKMWC